MNVWLKVVIFVLLILLFVYIVKRFERRPVIDYGSVVLTATVLGTNVPAHATEIVKSFCLDNEFHVVYCTGTEYHEAVINVYDRKCVDEAPYTREEIRLLNEKILANAFKKEENINGTRT